MNFEIPPVNDLLPAIPSFSIGELAAIPSTALASIANSQSSLLSGINKKAAGIKKRAEKLSGSVTAYLPTQGRIPVESTASAKKSLASVAAAVGPIVGTASLMAASIEILGEGVDILENSEEAGTSIGEAASIAGSLGNFIQQNIPTPEDSPNAPELVELNASLASFASDASIVNANLTAIKSVLTDRASGVLAEPILILDHLIGEEDLEITKIVDNFNTFVQDNIVHPYEENIQNFGNLAQQTQLKFQEDPPMFDFSYGPPVTKEGIFILTESGLYYDVINGGIPEVSGVVIASENWNLRYAPNLGGKGKTYSKDNLENISDNVFANYHIPITDDENVYYESDEVLRLLNSNKQLHINILNDQIADLVASGVGEDSAVMVNHYSNIGAIASMYAERSLKRRKQLQLVSIFASDLYSHTIRNDEYKDLGLGDGVLIKNEGTAAAPNWHPIERIPINDFTFLNGTGAGTTIEQQESILLFSEDLDETVLPITPKFNKPTSQPYTYLNNFTLSPAEEAVFPYIEGDSHVSGTSNTILSLTNTVIQSGLVLNYNFLDPRVTTPSSLEYTVADDGPNSFGTLNGQLVASSNISVFPSGLSIPKLTGTTGGSYVRLPTNYTVDGTQQDLNTQDINNLFYPANARYDTTTEKGGGVTFDFWTHMPNFTMTDSHRYRLIAACENSGGIPTNNSLNPYIDATRTDAEGLLDLSKVHGMIMGFRDKGGIGVTASGLEFGIWPTVSQNQNNGAWGHTIAIAEDEFRDELGVTLLNSTEVEGVSFTDASANFIHMAVVFDFKTTLLNIYVDGVLLKSQSIVDSFDMKNMRTLNIPSVTRTGEGLEASWEATGDAGPNVGVLGSAFTPWILGGGFSDTILRTNYNGSPLGNYNPGFLGYNTNSYYLGFPFGQHSPSLGSVNPTPSSGLDGFLGSFKLYSKALSNKEVRTNFKAQKGFFKNIKTS